MANRLAEQLGDSRVEHIKAVKIVGQGAIGLLYEVSRPTRVKWMRYTDYVLTAVTGAGEMAVVLNTLPLRDVAAGPLESFNAADDPQVRDEYGRVMAALVSINDPDTPVFKLEVQTD